MKRILSIFISSLMIVMCLFPNINALAASTNNDAGTAYYVDSKDGDDTNSGTSVGKPWKTLDKVNSVVFQPGDKILFKADCSWTGILRPKGSGAEGKPIVIDMYGIGNKPIINGAGIKVPEEKFLGSLKYSFTLLLDSQSYWEVNNLELTNNAPEPDYRLAVYVTGFYIFTMLSLKEKMEYMDMTK
jgi:hypothetical protein